MCLTIPGKIIDIKEGMATVRNARETVQIDMGLLLDAEVGNWVLYATNRAVKLIFEEDAAEIISLLEEKYGPVNIEKLPKRFVSILSEIRNPKSEIRNKFKTQNSKNRVNGAAATRGDGIPALQPQAGMTLEKKDIEYLLSLTDKDCLETLYAEANVLRKQTLEDFVCIHGIIEFSNYCKNNCIYCGIRKGNNRLKRYRMAEEEIIETAKEAVEEEGYKLLVLQSGEDEYYTDEMLIRLIGRIKSEMKVFIFLSVGERNKEFYKNAWKVGATGSLIRFETSNPELYAKLKPGHRLEDRLQLIRQQQEMGYYVASGSMVGLPGQTIGDIADDLLMIKELGVPMISAGPWLPASGTPLKNIQHPTSNIHSTSNIQMANGQINVKCEMKNEKLELMLKYIAVARLMMPEIKIPVTTALETLDPENGRHRGLLAGANALMFNLTPEKYAGDYSIYDNKYREREKVWQKYGLFKGEESWEMLEQRLQG